MRKIILFVTTLLLSISSCKKDLITNSSSLVGQLNANKFFEMGIASSDVVNGKVYHDSSLSNPAIAIQLVGPSSTDLIVTGVVDTTLCRELIDYYKSNDLIPRNGSFALVRDTLTVHAGTDKVTDSLYGKLMNAFNLDSSGIYLVPVRLTANNNENLIANKIALFRMQFIQNNYYGQLSNGSFYSLDNPNSYNYSSTINGYGFFDVQINRINNHAVGDLIFNLTPRLSLPFLYASLKIKAGMSFEHTIIDSFKNAVDSVQKLKNYAIMPSKNVTIPNKEVIVQQNNYYPSDDFIYRLSKLNSLSVDSNYLFCMTLPDNRDTNYFPPSPIRANSNFFVRVKCVDLNSQNVDSNNTVINGNEINRNSWTVYSSTGDDSVYNANYNSNIPSAAIDGNPQTYWAPSGYSTSNSFYINMGITNNVKGFRILPNYNSSSMDILIAEILSSNDGKEWDSQGYYFGSATDPNSTISNPDYKYIHFNSPVNARYFQLRITSTSNYYGTTSIPEIIAFN